MKTFRELLFFNISSRKTDKKILYGLSVILLFATFSVLLWATWLTPFSRSDAAQVLKLSERLNQANGVDFKQLTQDVPEGPRATRFWTRRDSNLQSYSWAVLVGIQMCRQSELDPLADRIISDAKSPGLKERVRLEQVQLCEVARSQQWNLARIIRTAPALSF